MWFLPLYDENPSFRKPVLTYAIMAICVAWYFGYQSGQAPQAILEYGFIPARLFAGYDPSFEYGVSPLPVFITFLTTMISHGGFMHMKIIDLTMLLLDIQVKKDIMDQLQHTMSIEKIFLKNPM